MTSLGCVGPEDFSTGGYKDEDSGDNIWKMVGLALGLRGLTEGRATTVIEHDDEHRLTKTYHPYIATKQSQSLYILILKNKQGPVA